MSDQASTLRELAHTGRFQSEDVIRSEPRAHRFRQRCMSIAVTSGKGGVGKTNIALSLAVALSRMKKKVLLFDADFGLANLHLLLGVAPAHSLLHVVRGERAIEQVLWDGPMGIDIIPGASGIEAMANMDAASQERLSSALERMEQSYDFMIIDTAAGIGGAVIRFASLSDLPLLVLTPEPTSLADGYATIKILFEKGMGRIGALVNMAASDREGIETFDRLNTLVVKFLKKRVVPYGILPYESDVPKSVKRQQVLVLDKPGSRFSEKIQTVAWKVSGMSSVSKESFFCRFWQYIRRS
ncbi:MAG: MinD/ParA family protein [Chitinispirillaceae bacterium]|nr:MinD/ParA family protein [Chitinispirillaceae bacterium]